MKLSYMKVSTVAVLLVFLLGIIGVFVVGKVYACPKCECYLDADCPEDRPDCTYYFQGHCREWKNEENKTRDGLCKGSNLKFFWRRVDPNRVVAAIDLYFQAYMDAIRGDGQPNEELLNAAQRVSLRPSRTWHNELQRVVHDALDTVLGFDFHWPQLKCSKFGSIVGLPDTNAAVALVEHTREGFMEAILNNNPDMMEEHIMSFWRVHTEYAPLHTGRCYPHGHPEQSAPEVCQIDSLKRTLRVLLEGREGK